MLETLITTVLRRPYVVGFLISYIVIACRMCGWRFAVFHLFSAYWIAFSSEYLSINFGFPYGEYHYLYDALAGEWLNHGVPVWDSASYVFMCFAGLAAARIAWGRRPLHTLRQRLTLIGLSSLFVTLLDIITDPVAHMGERWFLGKIYYYPHPGWYFDITLANFFGWALVSFLINACAEFVWRFSKISADRESFSTHLRRSTLLGLGLYYGIAAFSLSIAIALQEWKLVLCDLIWLALSLILILIIKATAPPQPDEKVPHTKPKSPGNRQSP